MNMPIIRNQVGRRVAVVAGLRTPFVKANTVFNDLTALDLGRLLVAELIARSELNAKEIDQLIFGQVIPGLTASSIAREIVLLSGLPRNVEAHTVVRACATSIQTAIAGANAIALGQADVVVAGGTESMSDPPIFTSRPLARALVAASKAKDFAGRFKPFQKLKPKDLLPVPPAIAEYTTGLSMGESAEKMARENNISRQEQDEIALASHRNAARAWKNKLFDVEVMHVPVPPKYAETVAQDNMVREDTTMEALLALRPAFDKKYGSVTAGNASPLTDGAAAIILMSEEKAKSLGYAPLGFIRSHAFAATDPAGQLLQGPAYATPLALDRAGMTLNDIDLIDMHEAFSAQVASNIQALASKSFNEKLGRKEAVGEVDRSLLNVNGGSISLGHPFAATGARMIHQMLRELARRNLSTGLLTLCAQGGQGAAVILERT
jgi:acetyl-CoA acyltransferase